MTKAKSTTANRKTTKTKKTTSKAQTKKIVSGNFVEPYRKLSRKNVLIIAAVFTLIGISTVAYSFAATPTTTLEAERLSYTATPVPVDTSGTSVTLSWDTIGTGTIDLPTEGTEISLLAKGTGCQGSPEFVVKIDDKEVMKRAIISNVLKNYKQTLALSKGTHKVSIAFLNDYYLNSGCDRNLTIDKLVVTRVLPIIQAPPAPAPAPSPTPAPALVVTAPVVATPPAPTPSTPVNTDYTRMWIDKNRRPNIEANLIRKTRPADAALLDKIASNPSATWVGGYTGDDRALTNAILGSRADKSVMVLSVYGVPFRDAGHYSGGGHADFAAYAQWIDWIANKVGDTHAIMIIEPDSVAMSLPVDRQAERWKSLNYAITKLGALPYTKVYLDGGTPGWKTPEVMAERMKLAGVANADGFAVNVANFKTNTEVISYGKKMSALMGNKPFVIDTSRNGNGAWVPPAGETEAWCNPPGRALGARPTFNTGVAGVDAYLWVKVSGGSDGACRGYPKSGDWIESLALDEARNAKW